MKSSNIKRNMGRLTNSACALLFAGTVFVSCKDELLTGMPEWLGSSIYEELQARGEYGTTLRLIDDPVFAQEGLPTMLRQTGSKTLFVAKDDAYARFFQSNPWGVHRYEDLSDAQKLLLVRTSMLNNAFLMELLSTTEAIGGNTELGGGQAMRHPTSVTLYDSIQVLKSEDMPNNKFWDKYRDKNMLVVRDNTVPYISHFLPAFMSKKQYTNEDISFLTNGAYADISASYFGGNKVIEQDVTCQNGYIQVVDNVIQPLTSMAEVIGNNPDYSIMKSFLDRFSFPVYYEEATREYNRLHNNGEAVDSVYVWRYLNNGFDSQRSNTAYSGTYGAIRTPDGTVANSMAWADILPYDPGWNRFYNTVSGTMEDMAVFVVPTDAAFRAYEHDGGAGQELFENYGSDWNNVPDNIIAKLLQNLMKSSLNSTLPSKFHTVLNSAQQPFFKTQADRDAIKRCHLTTNGMIYESDKVFSAPDYVSVSFPVILDDGMSVIEKAITDLQFNNYLNSMDSKYTFLPPTNNALARYIDPVDIHKTANRQTYTRFYISDNGSLACERRYIANGRLVSNSLLSESEYIRNRMRDIMNNSIIVGNVEDSLRMGYYVFATKGGAPVIFEKKSGGYPAPGNFRAEDIHVKGPWQIEQDEDYIQASAYTNMENSGGNGVTAKLDVSPVMPASKSVVTVLSELAVADPDSYGEFYEMLSANPLVVESYDNGKTMSNGKTIAAMNNYQYTVYVPKSSTIKDLYTSGVLPDFRTITKENILEEYKEEWADLIDKAENGATDEEKEDAQAQLDENVETVMIEKTAQITAFLRYHIQNSALYIGSNIRSGKYETTLMDSQNGRFYSLTVTPGQPGERFKVRCNGYDGNAIPGVPVREVLNTENHFAREYHFRTYNEAAFNNLDNADVIYNSSYAVVHSIDGPLLYKADMLTGNNKIK